MMRSHNSFLSFVNVCDLPTKSVFGLGAEANGGGGEGDGGMI